ncbi:MAG TPA: replication factor C large subunit [archaeon]|nr:replication factor C large subunit [archaeon]
MWNRKYKPRNLSEYVGQKENVEVFLKWVKNWTTDSKPLMFYGASGIGKTALVEAYAEENNLDLIQVNASDQRNAEEIKRVIGSSVSQKSLFKRGKIFLIDEIDGISGRDDRGGVGEVIKTISQTKFPTIFICNDAYSMKLRELRNYCQLVQFKKISVYDVEKRLKQICEKETIKYDDLVIKQIAKSSNGDLRSAINDLETVSKNKSEITANDMESVGLRERDRNIFDALNILFKTQDFMGAKLSIEGVDKDPDEIFWWIENNIANEYEDPKEIVEALDKLSMADLFRRRISYRQNWKLLSYVIDFMTIGVSQAKKQMYRKFTRYEYPKNIMMLGQTKFTRKEETDALNVLSKHFHASKRKLKAYYLPYLKQIADKKFVNNLSIELNIDRENIVTLLKQGI